MTNEDRATVEGFGDEWSRFDNVTLSAEERAAVFGQYFARFPWASLSPQAEGFDAGCGSGRWAALVAPRCRSAALRRRQRRRARGREGAAGRPRQLRLPYRFGVLRCPSMLDRWTSATAWVCCTTRPNPEDGLRACAAALKPGAPFLLYLYYRFDNQPLWFRWIWAASNLARMVVSRLPRTLRFAVCDVVAALVYWPLARTARMARARRPARRLLSAVLLSGAQLLCHAQRRPRSPRHPLGMAVHPAGNPRDDGARWPRAHCLQRPRAVLVRGWPQTARESP